MPPLSRATRRALALGLLALATPSPSTPAGSSPQDQPAAGDPAARDRTTLQATPEARPRSRRLGTAPQVGEPAPTVSAVTPGGKEVDLSKPRRATVLVFGSHT